MQSFSFFSLVALLAAATVQAGYTAVLTGTNSEGGGGPGQAPLDNNAFAYSIKNSNGKSTGKVISPNGENNSFKFTVTAAEFGGTKDADVGAQWDAGSNSWYRCEVTCGTANTNGTVGKTKIDTDIVSTSTDLCTIDFQCS